VGAVAEFEAQIFHISEFSDNADLRFTDEASEREDTTGFGFSYNRAAKNWAWSADYEVRKINFDTNSRNPQEDTDEYGGTTSFSGSFFRQRFDLLASHTRENILSNPSDLSLQNNILARDTIVLQPAWNFYKTNADTLSIGAFFHQVNFDDDVIQRSSIDSNTEGARFLWSRELSNVSTFSLIAESSETEYKQDNIDDLSYENYQIGYAVELRRLSYRVLVGFNKSSSSTTEELESPSGLAQITYNTGGTQIDLFANFFITDSSRGNQNGISGNNIGETSSEQIGNGDTSIADSYELLTSQLSITKAVCSRCVTDIRFRYAEEDYSVDEEESQERIDIIWGFSYRVTPSITGRFETRFVNQSFDIPDPIQEFDQIGYGLNVEYRLSEKLRMAFELGYEERDAENDLRSYEEQTALFEVRYQL
jgi:hypothetical protein